jgi:hypothetical protein
MARAVVFCEAGSVSINIPGRIREARRHAEYKVQSTPNPDNFHEPSAAIAVCGNR